MQRLATRSAFLLSRRPIARVSRVPLGPSVRLGARFGSTKIDGEVSTYVAVKSTTGLVGLEVVPHAREVLIRMYQKYLGQLEQFPEGTPYRAHMSKLVNYRLEVLNSTTDIFAIEEKLHFQLEQLIDMQEDEFTLVPFMLEHKPWEQENRWEKPFVVYSHIA